MIWLRPYTTAMFAELLKRLVRPEPCIDPADARLALTALLVRIARADADYSAVEIDRIDQITALRFGLDTPAAKDLRSQAETLEAEAPDTVRFTRAIKAAVPYEERRAVLEAMWQVVLADGARAQEEDALMRVVARLLGIEDRDSALARQQAQTTP